MTFGPVPIAAVAALVFSFAAASLTTAQTRRVAQRQEEAFGTWLKENEIERGILTIADRVRAPLINRGYGGQDPEERVLLASLSKPITGRCIAQLIVDDRLGLATKVGDVLAPFFSRFGKPADSRVNDITIAQLLDHRAGFAASPRDLMTPAAVELLTKKSSPANATPQELLAAALTVPLESAPGDKERYSNIGYLLLGVIVEVVAGESYEQYCGRSVLTTAGIDSPRLDADWRAFSSFGGWKLSGAEYLRFLTSEPQIHCRPLTFDDIFESQRRTGRRSLELWKYEARCGSSAKPFHWLGQTVSVVGTWVTMDGDDKFRAPTSGPAYRSSVFGSWGISPKTYGLMAVNHAHALTWFAWYSPRTTPSGRDRLFDALLDAAKEK